MADNIIKVNVTANKPKSVTVSSANVGTEITASSDTGRFWAQTAKNWAVSDVIVDNTDYSSKHYALEAKESASNAQGLESAIRDVYNGFVGETTEAIENVQGARDDAIANIETSRVDAIDSINSTKTTILNDIEFVAEGEKKDIQDLADEIKDSGDTVNIAIEAGVERLNSIDALKKSQITNCITEIPQNIKLELADGVLTLKAGSKVIVPNGFEADGTTPKFDEVVVNSDVTKSLSADTSVSFIEYNPANNELFVWGASICSSGATQPTSQYFSWYDTTNNKMKNSNNSGATISDSSLPIAITNNTRTSIDQVFNGFGYIGSTIWVDKGVKGLIPNGRNEDGTLNNIEFVTTGVKTRTLTNNNGDWYVALNPYITWTSLETYGYDEEKNMTLSGGINWNACVFGRMQFTNGKITSLQPKQPFRAVDYNDVKDYIKSERYDGQWIYKTLQLTTATAIGTYTIDLSSYLPKDSYNYEVIVTACAYSSGGSGAMTSFKSDLVTDKMYFTYTNTNSRHDSNTIIVPVSATKKIYYVIEKATVEHHTPPTVRAYRRIGTNL